MKQGGFLKLVGEVRDLQIVDAEYRRCGIADDIECEGNPGRKLVIHALLIGPGAYKNRLPRFAFWLITLIFGNRIVKVSWNEIEYITSVIRLKKPAGAYGLMKTERRFGAAVSKVPFA